MGPHPGRANRGRSGMIRVHLMRGATSLGWARRDAFMVGVGCLAGVRSVRRVAAAVPRRRPRRRRLRAGATCPPPSTASAPSEDRDPPSRRRAPLRRCFPEQPAWVDAPVADLLDKAAELFDKGDYAGTLACAEEAARAAPRSVEAHHNRAIALMRLDRLDEARDALELALALSPDDPETLEAAADLQINQLPPSSDRSALGLEYARRGSRHVSRRDGEEVARLALLGGAGADRSRAGRRGAAADRRRAGRRSRTSAAAVYERGVALFELCRFDEARATFTKVLAETPDHAHALYHLGLIEERAGDEAAAGAPPGSGHRRRSQVVPAGAADHAARLRGAGPSARWRRCRPTSAGISRASTCRPPISRIWRI